MTKVAMDQKLSHHSGSALPGFQNPVFDATTVFRDVMDAFSRPGRLHKITVECAIPVTLDLATSAILLTLADNETPLWLDPEINAKQTRDFLKFHTGCSHTDTIATATFAVAGAKTSPKDMSAIAVGSPDYPDRATTLIIQVDHITESSLTNQTQTPKNATSLTLPITLTGPGILNAISLEIRGLTQNFWQWRNSLCQNFPCGIDVIFTHQGRFVAIPRSTKVEY